MLYHTTKNDRPQLNWLPTKEHAPSHWQGDLLKENRYTYLHSELGNDPRLVHVAVPDLPYGAYWIYEIRRIYGTEAYRPDSPMLDAFCNNPRLIGELKAGPGRLLFNDCREADIDEHYIEMISTFFSSRGIPLSRVIFANGAKNLDDIFKTRGISMVPWCVPALDIMNCAKIKGTMPEDILQETELPAIPPRTDIKKKFLCFNRRSINRTHRIQLLAKIYSSGMLNDFWYSFGSTVEGHTLNTSMSTIVEPPHWNTVGIMQELRPRLPLVLDNSNFDTDLSAYHHAKDVEHWYKHSAISVVTETHYHTSMIFITEKTFHPICFGQPFILVGSPGMLRSLRNDGYRTWDRWWDESYDDIQDHDQRLEKIVDVISSVRSWPNEKLQQFVTDSYEICMHNRQNLAALPSRLQLFDQLQRFFTN